MASKKVPFKKYYIPISQQIIAMNLAFPDFKVEWKKNTVIWTGSLQPTPLSKGYTVEIAYSLDMQQPEVIVLNPSLQKRGKEKIPHVYPGNKLCLFRPKKKEWTKQMFIFETIVPWASLWLYYYEVWHATGEWLGGGEHPIARKKQKKSVS
ncbi:MULTISPECIES: hypothetical protein [Bacillus cereus group]|uniref:hypothetical protein n=1 Tax=Bacillus cereus group TaxID=86661 RepID=UPI000BB0188C|nr:hypothetical protein [Bacillus cereus group sp. BfR-BA-01495]ASZ15882.1 hypothetical protein CK938_04365 [Bacillus cereus]HDR7793173.1 hypothetical protein [Bacillus luti]